MADSALPANLVSSGKTPTFTEETIPDALQREHRLAQDTWGVLHLIGGKIRFVDLEPFRERIISAPDQVTILPGAPHRVAIEGPVEFRIDLFREQDLETPGGQAE